MTAIAIKYDSDGKITNRFIGTKKGEEWTMTHDIDWPEPAPADDEVPLFYYDDATDEITVEYETVTHPDDPDA